MNQPIQINAFNKKTAESIAICSNFSIFLEKHDINKLCQKILEIPWDNYQAIITDLINNSLNNFTDIKPLVNKIHLSKKDLAGVYFCIGDDGLSLSIGGSLYYNEQDWAANADFYPEVDNEKISSLINKLLSELISLNLDETVDTNILCCFMAYSVNKALIKTEKINEIANAVMAFGYSDGDELILGHFKKGKFIQNIKVIKDGEYKNQSTAPIIEYKTKPRGDAWHYLKHNYNELIKREGLSDRLNYGGEEEAEKILREIGNTIFINTCSICGAIKRTPRARLCPKCCKFT